MRIETNTFTVYEFKELSEKAKNAAIEDFRYINVEFEWWDFLYNDAKELLNIDIEAFDLGRSNYVNFKFKSKFKSNNIDLDFYKGVNTLFTGYETDDILNNIQKYINDFDKLDNLDEFTVDEIEDKLEPLYDSILKDLESLFLRYLKDQCEYLTNDEQIIEYFEMMGTEFLESGKEY